MFNRGDVKGEGDVLRRTQLLVDAVEHVLNNLSVTSFIPGRGTRVEA